MSASDNPRRLALAVARRVVEEGAYSNLALGAALERSVLRGRDRALATELAYGTLRRLVSIDWALQSRSTRPLDRVSPGALAVLRLGAYQLLFTRIPAHAAVSETVGLADPRERGFVNAILRNLARRPPSWPRDGSPDSISVRTGLCSWAVRELGRLMGDDCEKAAAALAEQASLTLRTNTCRATVEDLQERLRASGVVAHRGTVHPESLVVESAQPRSLPGFAEGWFTVQDQASSFVVRALDPQPGDRVLDACAGPGGKATHAACLVGPQGRVVGADLSWSRAHLVKQAAARLGLGVDPLAQDARRHALRGPFDRILVDAPCSGLGAARRRPELLWRPRRDGLSRLAQLQVGIAASVAALLRPGGRLVYSVCTFPRAETDAACDALLRQRPELRPEPLQGPDGAGERIRLWPHAHSTDAMFVAAFARVE